MWRVTGWDPDEERWVLAGVIGGRAGSRSLGRVRRPSRRAITCLRGRADSVQDPHLGGLLPQGSAADRWLCARAGSPLVIRRQ